MNRLVVLAGAAAIALSASDAGAQMTQWVPPACKLNTKHFLVNSAQLYLKNATGAKSPEQRQTSLKDAGRILKEAVTTGGQAENPAVWYMYGRYYLLTDSMAGADSSFRKAQAGQPDCADDIIMQRRSAWVPNVQAAADALNKNEYATAKSSFRKANAIYQGDPIGFYYLANVFINEGEVDSAITYFKKSVQYSDRKDTSQTETYETSVFNVGRLFHQQQQWDSAVTWYERYRQEKPADMQGLTGLAVVYDAKGDTARASKLYDEILTNAETVPALDLFSTGISLFRGGQYERAAQAFQAALKKNPYYRDALYNLASTYLSMANVPDTVLLTPKARDSIGQAVKDAAKANAIKDSILRVRKDSVSLAIGKLMLPVTRQLVALDPQNQSTLRMLAVAYQYFGDQDSTLKALERAEALPFEVAVQAFQPTEKGYSLMGNIKAFESNEVRAAKQHLAIMQDSLNRDTGRLDTLSKSLATGKDPNTGKPILSAIRQALQQGKPTIEKRIARLQPAVAAAKDTVTQLQSKPVSVPPVTFEFIDARGQTITSQVTQTMQVSPNSSQNFSLTVAGEGIQGWRYKVGA